MKAFRILGRSIRDAFKSVSRNFSLSIASITCTAITLVLVSIAMLLSYNVNNFTKEMEEELTIVVFLTKETTIEEIDLIESKILAISNVSNVDFKSKEETKEEMMEGSDTYNSIMSTWTEENNPLQHTFIVSVTDVEEIKTVANQIKELSNVDTAKYGEDMIDQVISVFGVVEKATLVIVLALILVTAFLISNTIKITIFSRKSEIEIMRLVGARNIAIKLPFLFEGLFLGIIGSIVPVIITIYGYTIAYDKLGGFIFSNMIRLVKPAPFIFYVSLIILGVGAVVGMVGSYRAVRKYLKI